MVNEIWIEFDQDDSGHLDKEETRRFLKRIFEMVGLKRNFDNDEFNDFFRSVDLTNDGKISKAEMKNFFSKMGLEQEKNGLKLGGREKHANYSVEERRYQLNVEADEKTTMGKSLKDQSSEFFKSMKFGKKTQIEKKSRKSSILKP